MANHELMSTEPIDRPCTVCSIVKKNERRQPENLEGKGENCEKRDQKGRLDVLWSILFSYTARSMPISICRELLLVHGLAINTFPMLGGNFSPSDDMSDLLNSYPFDSFDQLAL